MESDKVWRTEIEILAAFTVLKKAFMLLMNMKL